MTEALINMSLLTLLAAITVAIIGMRNLFGVVVLNGIYSFLMASVMLVLDGVDVAMTEASVGAGISTVLMLTVLYLTKSREALPIHKPLIPLFLTGGVAIMLLLSVDTLPPFGSADTPVNQSAVSTYYLEKSVPDTGIPNVVTSVLASYRGFDTLGEVFVVFSACIGVLFILGVKPPEGSAYDPNISGLRHHLIPQVVGRLLIPFIVLFGLYVQFHGEYGPGGGFQAGALIASGVIMYALLEGEAAALSAVPQRVLMGLVIGGACLYGGVGLLCILLGGNFLEYSVLSADPVSGQQLGILLIEAGVGMAVCGALLSIFHAFAARPMRT